MRIRYRRIIHATATLIAILLGLFSILASTERQNHDFTIVSTWSISIPSVRLWTAYADFSAWYDEGLSAAAASSHPEWATNDFISTFGSYEAAFFDTHALVFVPTPHSYKGSIDTSQTRLESKFGILFINAVYERSFIDEGYIVMLPTIFIVDDPGTLKTVWVSERWIRPSYLS